MLKLTTKKTKWFVFPQDPSGEAKVEILHLKPGEEAEIESASNQIVGRPSGEEFVTEVQFKPSYKIKELIKKVIVNFEGFKDESGEDLEVTNENKLKLLNEFDWFYDQIDKFRKVLAEEVKKEQEGAEKN